MFKANQITAIFIVFGGLLVVLYDIFALYFMGAEHTISCIVNEWAYRSPLGIFIAGMIFGGLIVHFLKWAPLEKQIKD